MVEWSPQPQHHHNQSTDTPLAPSSPFHFQLHSPMDHRRRDDPPEFNLREWDSKAKQNTNSRRFSASNITSFREDIITRRSSFRSNITISSTASSPGYPLIKDEIDPSTYSFTTALKALQAKSGFCNNKLECLSPEGFALHSKWNDAEKYISNPQSGRVPMECLSARSFQNFHDRITMSAPLVYSTNSRPVETKLSSLTVPEIDLLHIPIQEKKVVGTTTRDIGIQIGTQVDSSSSSSPPSPLSTPSIQDRAPKWYGTGGGESSNSSSKPKSEGELLKQEREDEEESSKKKESEKETSDSDDNSDSGNDQQQRHQIRRCGPAAGCLSWMIVRRHEREKHPPSTKTKKKSFSISFSGVKRS